MDGFVAVQEPCAPSEAVIGAGCTRWQDSATSTACWPPPPAPVSMRKMQMATAMRSPREVPCTVKSKSRRTQMVPRLGWLKVGPVTDGCIRPRRGSRKWWYSGGGRLTNDNNSNVPSVPTDGVVWCERCVVKSVRGAHKQRVEGRVCLNGFENYFAKRWGNSYSSRQTGGIFSSLPVECPVCGQIIIITPRTSFIITGLLSVPLGSCLVLWAGTD